MKIFINENILNLTDLKSENTKLINYTNKKELLKVITDLENNRISNINVFSNNMIDLISDFKTNYRIIYASGGIVRNENNDILFIKRLGKWDLPKGKIESGETKDIAAIREVEEETGLVNVKIDNFIDSTFHTYFINKERILKQTYWYNMKVFGKQKLIPQTIEDITEVKWINPNNLDNVYANTYGSIKQILTSNR